MEMTHFQNLMTSETVSTMVAVGALAATLLVAFPAAVIRRHVRTVANQLNRFNPQPEPRSQSPLAGEIVRFPSLDGHELEGVILRGSGPASRRGMVMFAHEFGHEKTSCLKYSGFLRNQGFDIFTFDFRGHGNSLGLSGYLPRPWPGEKERQDATAAIDFLTKWLLEHGRRVEIGLFGISRGAGAVLLSAAGRREVRCIVTDGAFSTDVVLETLMRRYAPMFSRAGRLVHLYPRMFWRFLRWLAFRECARERECSFPSVLRAIDHVAGTPVFFIHGEKDGYVDAEQSRAMFQRLGGASELWIVKGAKHNKAVLVAPAEYAKRVGSFFRRHLGASLAWDARVDGISEPHQTCGCAHQAKVAALELEDAASPSENGVECCGSAGGASGRAGGRKMRLLIDQ